MKGFARNACYALIILLAAVWMKRGETSFAHQMSAYVDYVLHTDLDPAPFIDHLLRVWHTMWPPFGR